MPMTQSRRRFLTTLSMAGATGFLRAPPSLAAQGALETTTVRIAKLGAVCIAPQFIAEELLRAEGFTNIHYVDVGPTLELSPIVGRGQADFTLDFAARIVQAIDDGGAITVLGGVHIGCYELFAKEGVRGIAELKGKSVGLKTSPPDLLALMAAQVGLDPVNDLRWVTSTDASVDPLELFAEGKIDAFLGFPPEPQELRARHIGHVIVSTAVDGPWSQYFCCMLTGNREYVRKYPVATKGVLRAILKAADLCASEPARVAQSIVDRGFIAQSNYPLETLSELPYDKWREYDSEDTIRFYALRLREIGKIKSSPQKIIADGTDWRFLNELKRELKA
jgi:NitT/TauT family transport system substrate-binding protein